MNDDCLKEVFASMSSTGLAAVADVCVRFRQNSMHSARLKCNDISLNGNFTVSDYTTLRNFGAFINSISVFGECGQEPPTNGQKRGIELFSRYCVGTSVDLEISIYDFNITNEIALLMVPLLARAKSLSFNSTQLDKTFLENLPSWAPELHELRIDNDDYEEENQLKNLRHKFPKLETLSFYELRQLEHSDIEEFLKQNPQIKEFGFTLCNRLDDSILRSLAKYVPGIEKLDFCTKRFTMQSHIKYVGQLRKLKSLSLTVYYDGPYMQAIIHKIGSTNIALEHLDLIRFDFSYKSGQFVNRVAKLQHLKTLKLSWIENMKASHLIAICKSLKQLEEVELDAMSNFEMTVDDLLELIKNSEKLQEFAIYNWGGSSPFDTNCNIDTDIFNQLVGFVELRRDKTPLTLRFHQAFTASVPKELRDAAANLITLELQ